MQLFKDERGFTLTEVMVSAGLLGILGMGIMYGTETMKKMELSSRQATTIGIYNSEGLSNMKGLTQGMTWEKLDYTSSYVSVENDRQLAKVGWTASDLDSVVSVGDLEVEIQDSSGNRLKIKRDAHTLVYSRSGKLGVYFSRCVEERDYSSDMTPVEAFALSYVPYLVKDGDGNSVRCCKRASANLCSNRVDRPSSNYRVMTFNLRDKSFWKVLPNSQDKNFLLGSGFMIYLNRSIEPDSYKAYYFNIPNMCYSAKNKGNCDKTARVNIKSINGEISTKSIFESGQLIIQ